MNREQMVNTLMSLLNNNPVEHGQGVILNEDGEVAAFTKQVGMPDGGKAWYGPRYHLPQELRTLRAETGKHHQHYRWWEVDGPDKIQAAVDRFYGPTQE
jgi:hypothetical protein